MDGLFDADLIPASQGPQEKQTRKTIAAIVDGHPGDDPIRDALCVSLLSLARSIDAQNLKGREISRNMNVYLTALEQLRDLYPDDTDKPDDDVIAAWTGTGIDG